MPINRLLKDGQHTPEQIELLNSAFNHALNLLNVADRNDPFARWWLAPLSKSARRVIGSLARSRK
jgi:hypothetical protein